MLEHFENPDLCRDCPMREGLEGDPRVAAEISWQSSGDISADRQSVSFKVTGGKPEGDRLSTVVIGSEGEPISEKAVFTVSGRKFDNGEVEQAFKDCEGPTTRKGGFLKLQTRIGCTAVEKLQDKQ